MGIETAFLGTLGKDAEPKTSKTGKPYLRAGVRVGDGEGAQWVNVTAFDPEAIARADNFIKGSRVYVEGRLTLDTWTAEGGEKRSSLSCLSWHCRLAQIGRNKQKRTRHTGAPSVAAGSANFGDGTSQAARGELDDEIPF
jgi:single-stranded DNA-binding protein